MFIPPSSTSLLLLPERPLGGFLFHLAHRKRTLCGTLIAMNGDPLLTVVFFRTDTGREPVRDWLKSLELEDRKIIGEDFPVVIAGPFHASAAC